MSDSYYDYFTTKLQVILFLEYNSNRKQEISYSQRGAAQMTYDVMNGLVPLLNICYRIEDKIEDDFQAVLEEVSDFTAHCLVKASFRNV